MKKGGQKKKSYAHETAVGKIFSQAYYHSGDGLFIRRDSVGGIRDKKDVPGDLIAFKYLSQDKEEMAIDKSFPFCLECKDWKDENVKHFFSGLYSQESVLWDWMRQSWEDALLSKKMPMVVFKLFRTENLGMLLGKDFYSLGNIFGNFPGKFYVLEKVEKEDSTFETRMIFFLLKDFVEWIDWENYKFKDRIYSIKSIIKGKE